MKIVHLAHFYWPHVGGVEKHIEMLAAELGKRDHTTRVITEQHDPLLKLSERKNSVEILRIPVDTSTKQLHKKTIWQWMWQQRALIFDADILHVHDVFWWLLPLVPLLILKQKRIYITFHGYQGDKLPSKKQIWWRRLAVFFTQGNFCIGGFHHKWYGVKPTQISFGAVEFSTQKQAKKSLREKKQAIFIGRLDPDNGILVYLEALKILQTKKVRWKLDVYGDGSQLSAAQLYVKKHNLDVKFHGFVPDADRFLPEYQVAFVSRYLAIIEALSARTWVVARYHNELTEDYLRQSPFARWILITDSPQVMVLQLEKIRSVSPQAQKWARQQTWKKMAQQYLQLWGVKA